MSLSKKTSGNINKMEDLMAERDVSCANSLMVCPRSRQNGCVIGSETSITQTFADCLATQQHPTAGSLSCNHLIGSASHAFVVSQSNLPQRKGTKMKAECMNQLELAVRWKISHRTLERWRWTGEGPKFLKVGGRVVYRLADIEEYEQAIVRPLPCVSRAIPVWRPPSHYL